MDAQARRAARQAHRAAQRAAAWRDLGLTRERLTSLQSRLGETLPEHCPHDLTHTRAWAEAAGLDWHQVHKGLRSQDVFCDCAALDLNPDDAL